MTRYQCILQIRVRIPKTKEEPKPILTRLNYIGSKYKLLDWITTYIKQQTGWETFEGKTVADLFAGTGIVSYHLRSLSARVISNDAELYSSIITHAYTRSVYSDVCQRILHTLQQELCERKYSETVGYITRHYSPYESNERQFFTVDNAQRIDYLRSTLETIRASESLSDDDYYFLLASILIAADSVSNVPAVYGCYLKTFKAKALKPLTLTPIHTTTVPCVVGSTTFSSDITDNEFLESFETDVVYLDPPYNERQYSKNYFPLSIIAKTPEQLTKEPPLRGKTGIPSDCFMSPFCKKGLTVESAFQTLFRHLKTKWIFLSYNSESIVSKEKMIELMEPLGKVSYIERDYKRFKSFDYNKDIPIQEYLFCLQVHNSDSAL